MFVLDSSGNYYSDLSGNDRIEKLREEETILYNSLKEKYPNMSDEDLKKELHSRL